MATVFIETNKGKKRTSYSVKYRDPRSGKWKIYKTYRRRRDAEEARGDLRDWITLGKLSRIEESRKKIAIMSFSEVGNLLIEKWNDRLERGELSPKTVIEYQSWCRGLIKHFDKTLLLEMTKDDLLGKQKADLKNHSAVTANRNLFVTKQVFKHALEIGAIHKDPSTEVHYLSEKAHERNRYLLPPGIEVLLSASQRTKAKSYLPALIYLGVEHGASKQECLSLKWSDINFKYEDTGLIHFFRTKNRCERTDYLMPGTKKALLSWREHLLGLRKRSKLDTVDSDLVFSHADGSPIKSIKSAWMATCDLAGFRDLHFHDLRHTFCSNLILSGGGLKDAKDMIGHSELAMTDRYSHLPQQYKRVLQERLSQHYNEGK